MDVFSNRLLVRCSTQRQPDAILLMFGPSPLDIFSGCSYLTSNFNINEGLESYQSYEEEEQRHYSAAADSPIPTLYLKSLAYPSGIYVFLLICV